MKEEKLGRTANVQGRVSHIALAGIALFMHNEGRDVQTKSEIVGMACEYLYADLIRAGKIMPIPTTDMAVMILNRLGLKNLNRENRGLKYLQQVLEKDDKAISGAVDPKMWLIGQATAQALDLYMATPEGLAGRIEATAEDSGPSITEKIKLSSIKDQIGDGSCNVPVPDAIMDSIVDNPIQVEIPENETLEQKARRQEAELQKEKNAMTEFLKGFVQED